MAEAAALDLSELRRVMLELVRTGEPEQTVEVILGLLTQMQDHSRELEQRLAQLLKASYGRKSERIDPHQLRLLLEEAQAQTEAQASPAESAGPSDESNVRRLPAPGVSARRQTSGGRKPLPAELPREEVILLPTAEDLRCGKCAAERKRIGAARSEMLEWVPSQFKVIVHLREKYACPVCQEGVVIAPAPDKVIDGGLPGPGLLAHVLVAKYRDHTPLNRLSGIYARSGVEIPPSTLGDWVEDGALLVKPVADAIYRRVLAAHALQIDDTGLRVLDKHHPDGVKKGRIWGLVGDRRLVAFAYTPTWAGETARALVEDRKGWLQADGYAGLDELFSRRGATAVEVGCMAHCRRKFVEALEAGDVRAVIGVERIGELYALEREATALSVDALGRQKLREEHSRPVLDALGQWIAEVYPQAPPKSPLGKALTYAINQWKALGRFLEDGGLELDNNGVERALRAIAVGRKNWLFAGSDAGAKRAAILYTVIGSCALNDVEPWAYMRDVLEKLAGRFPQRRLEELLPDAWIHEHPEARLSRTFPDQAA